MGKFHTTYLLVIIFFLCVLKSHAQDHHVCKGLNHKYSMYGYLGSKVNWYFDNSNILQSQIIDASFVDPTDPLYYKNTYSYTWANTGIYYLKIQEIGIACSSEVKSLTVHVYDVPVVSKVVIVQDPCDTSFKANATVELLSTLPSGLSLAYQLKDDTGSNIGPAQNTNVFLDLSVGIYSVDVMYMYGSDIVLGSKVNYDFEIIKLIDTENPVARAKDITISLDATGQALISAVDVNNGSTDNCSIKSMTLSKTLFTCADIYPEQIVAINGSSTGLNVKLRPISINPTTNTCAFGYNYTVSIAYDISFVGNPPVSLYTMQGKIILDGQEIFFDLPNIEASGVVVSSNAWTGRTDCASVDINTFSGGDIKFEIQGDGIPNQTLMITKTAAITFTVEDQAGNTSTSPVIVTILNGANKPEIYSLGSLNRVECAKSDIEKFLSFSDLILPVDKYTASCASNLIIQYRIKLPNDTFVNEFGQKAAGAQSISDPSNYRFPIGISNIIYRVIDDTGNISNTQKLLIEILEKPNPSIIQTDN